MKIFVGSCLVVILFLSLEALLHFPGEDFTYIVLGCL